MRKFIPFIGHQTRRRGREKMENTPEMKWRKRNEKFENCFMKINIMGLAMCGKTKKTHGGERAVKNAPSIAALSRNLFERNATLVLRINKAKSSKRDIFPASSAPSALCRPAKCEIMSRGGCCNLHAVDFNLLLGLENVQGVPWHHCVY
jgi:hypothetical protein